MKGILAIILLAFVLLLNAGFICFLCYLTYRLLEPFFVKKVSDD